MKTQEGYEVVNVKPYTVYTTIYKNLPFDDQITENGFSGVVKDTYQDDRFTCLEFCIWNSKGELIYNGRWGEYKRYKIPGVVPVGN